MSRSQRRRAQRQAGKAYTKPDGPPPGERRDERIAYGAGCTWWGTIYQIGTATLGGLPMPCCPHCGGMLYEMPRLQDWMDDARAYAEQQGDPLYPAFIEWNQNRPCLSLHPERDGETAFARLRAQFEEERTKGQH